MLKKTALLLFLFLFEAFSAFAGEIRLSVAASITDAINQVCADYSKSHPGTTCISNFGASGTLAKQIAQGAPADLFISANPQWIDYLSAEKKISEGTVKPLAANRLVFVGARGTRAASLADLPRLKRIAIGSPKSVPAGQYSEEAMRKAGVYNRLVSEGKLVMALDVRQALVYADRGETDGAFVYKTDALLAKEAAILFEVPRELHTPITYPMALTIAGRANPEAQEFYRYLSSAEAGKVLTKFGFVLE